MKEPKIRFKGFRGEWEKKKLGAMTSVRGGYAFQSSLFQKSGIPVVRISNILSNGNVGGDFVYYPRLDGDTNITIHEKDVVIAMSGATTGKIARVDVGDGILYQNQRVGLFTKTGKVDYDFLYTVLNRPHFNELLNKLLTSSAQPNASSADIESIEMEFPEDAEEQKALSNYILSLDSLIQSTTKKIESLKQVKAASLQSMFPQEGETTPRVRFKGFEGEWSICPLKYFAKKSTEKNISMDYTITLTNSAEYGVINQRDFFDHDISNDDHINGYYVIHHDDFVYNPRVSTAAPVGPISRNRLGYSGVMSPLYLIFRVNGINKDFLSYYFKTTLWHNYMKLEGNTGARFDRLAISDEQFFNMPIYYPKDEEEQTAIASYFTNLDRQITLHTQRLEKLKQIKSACLDNMFV